MKKRTEGETSKFTPTPLDEELYFKLFDILHDGCMKGNWSATARALGISTLTARKWGVKPPRDPWTNKRLDLTIREVYKFMVNSKHKGLRRRAQIVKGQLERSGLSSMKEYMEYNEQAQAGAVRHLLVTISRAADSQISLNDLRLPGIGGGYSMRSFRHAAEILQLDKVTEGFGSSKKTYYRLPLD
jgi:hypothetical protein